MPELIPNARPPGSKIRVPGAPRMLSGTGFEPGALYFIQSQGGTR
jgi:hypothetical protein